MEITDHHIIASHGHFDVLAAAHSVCWPDGSSLDLHRVQVHGGVHTYLRAMLHRGAYWAVIDVRTLCKAIEADVCTLPYRDHVGAVMFNLRGKYTGASDMTLSVVAHAEALWHATPVEIRSTRSAVAA